MKKENEHKHLPPEDQLVIAAKVDRLYQVTAETFDPEVHVADAQNIVNALDPTIMPKKNSKRENRFSGYFSRAQSNIGQYLLRTEYYRIGNYLVTRWRIRSDIVKIQLKESPEVLALKMRAGGNLQELFTYIAIDYRPGSKDLERISRIVPEFQKSKGKDNEHAYKANHENILWINANIR